LYGNVEQGRDRWLKGKKPDREDGFRLGIPKKECTKKVKRLKPKGNIPEDEVGADVIVGRASGNKIWKKNVGGGIGKRKNWWVGHVQGGLFA